MSFARSVVLLVLLVLLVLFVLMGATAAQETHPASRPVAGLASMRGRVVDPDNRAIAHAGVELLPLRPLWLSGSTPSGPPALQVRTDQNGAFVIERIQASRVRLRVFAIGFGTAVTEAIEVAPGQVMDRGTVRLERGPRIEVTVVDANGEVVPVARVVLIQRWPDPSDPLRPGAPTNLVEALQEGAMTDGKTTKIAQPGPALVFAAPFGARHLDQNSFFPAIGDLILGSALTPVEIPAQGTVQLQLRLGPAARLRLGPGIDAQRVYLRGPLALAPFAAPRGREILHPLHALGGEDCRLIPGGYEIHWLSSCSREFREHDRLTPCPTWPMRIELKPGETTTVEAKDLPYVTVEATVTDAQRPAAEHTVWVVPLVEHHPEPSISHQHDAPIQTSGGGRFTLRDVTPGSYLLIFGIDASNPKHVELLEVPPGERSRAARFALSEGTVRVTARWPEQPAAAASVRAHLRLDTTATLRALGKPGLQPLVPISTNGGYAVLEPGRPATVPLPPGVYSLTVDGDGGLRGVVWQIAVRAGSTREVEVMLAPRGYANVSVRVADPSGAQLQGATVRATDLEVAGSPWLAARDGRFEDLWAGRHRFEIRFRLADGSTIVREEERVLVAGPSELRFVLRD